MNLSGKKVLVTGADGFIGSHLTESLLQQGCEVVALAKYNSFNTWGWLDAINFSDQSISIISGDIRDPYFMQNAMRGCNVVFHLAALIGIPYSYLSPQNYIETNVVGTLNVLQAAKDNKIEKLVHTSTSEVYGSALFVPINEDHPLQAQSPYSASKISADQIAMSFYYSFDIPVTILRPFNTYGPRQSARAVIPTIITQILNRQESIQLGSTSPTRDFNFVSDTVAGFVKSAESDDSIGEIINIGTNYEISVHDLFTLIKDIMHSDIELISDSIRIRPEKSEVSRLRADNSKARRLLDWIPAYSGQEGLNRGLQETIEWFRNEENLRFYKAGIFNV